MALASAAETPRSDPRAVGKLVGSLVFHAHENVAHIFPIERGGEDQTRNRLDGKVFQGMYRKVDSVLQKGELNLFGEDPLRAQVEDRVGPVPVPRGFDADDFGVDRLLFEFLPNPVGLP